MNTENRSKDERIKQYDRNIQIVGTFKAGCLDSKVKKKKIPNITVAWHNKQKT